MNEVSKAERATQHRVVQLLCKELGHRYQGDWTERAGNAPIEESLLTACGRPRATHPSK